MTMETFFYSVWPLLMVAVVVIVALIMKRRAKR